jgi:hypothetical protein
VEYTYQPGKTRRNARRQARTQARTEVRAATQSGTGVREVELGRSVLARIGYWLLMRSARAASPSQKAPASRRKTKVTRSVLRQNKQASDNLLSVVSANGRRNVVRVTEGSSRVDRNPEQQKKSVPDRRKAMNGASAVVSRSTAAAAAQPPTGRPLSSAGVSQIRKAGKRTSKHQSKSFEQDLFVKTERNIAAAMKEARKGISAEQLVIQFGLSVPEAGLIASLHK